MSELLNEPMLNIQTEAPAPGEEVYVGVDERVRRELAELIDPDGPDIEPSGRASHESIGYWDQDNLREYARWLVLGVMQIDIEQQPTIPLQKYIERASKLGLGPSTQVFTARGVQLSSLREELGFPPYGLFRDWTNTELVAEARGLSVELGGKLTKQRVSDLQREGRFVSPANVRDRLGSFGQLNERIGWITCYGWQEDDYLDWGAAVYRQNRGLRSISLRDLEQLSGQDRGPSQKSIYNNFDSIPDFSLRSLHHLEVQVDADHQRREERFSEVYEDVIEGQLPESVFAGTDSITSRTIGLRRAGVYQVVHTLTGSDYLARQFMNRRQIGSLARDLARRADNITAADFEITALLLGVYDDIWPMYRFQNVDLRLPNAA